MTQPFMKNGELVGNITDIDMSKMTEAEKLGVQLALTKGLTGGKMTSERPTVGRKQS